MLNKFKQPNYLWIESPIHVEHNGVNPVSVHYCIRKLSPYNQMRVIFIAVHIYGQLAATFSFISSKLLHIKS